MIYSIVVKDSNGVNITDVIQITVTDFQETYSAKIVDFVVERGLPISDNMTLDNDAFSISGVVSNYSDLTREIVLRDNEFVLVTENDNFEQNYSELIRNKLISLRNNQQIFSIYRSNDIENYQETLVEEIPNCALISVSFKYQKGQTGVIFPELQIKKLNISTTQTEFVENMIPRLAVNIKTPENEQSQSANSVSDAEIDKAIKESTAKPKPNSEFITDPETAAKIAKKNETIDSIIQRNADLKNLNSKYDKVEEITSGDKVLGYYLNDSKDLYAADGITILKQNARP